MTWHTSSGRRTLQGAEAALVRESLGYIVDMVEEEIDGLAEPWSFGVPLFDRLEPPARLTLLAEIGEALFRESESCLKLTGINEAAVAVLFTNVEQCIQFEIDSQDEDMDEPCFWRNRVLAVFRETEDDTSDDDLPAPNCTDWGEWSLLIDVLADRILWDDDFNDADQYLDAPPDEAAAMRDFMGIDDDYYRAIPPDPKDSDLPRIRASLKELLRP